MDVHGLVQPVQRPREVDAMEGLQGGRMADLEPVGPSVILPRRRRAGRAPGSWAAAVLSRGRTLVASGRRVLTTGPRLPVSMLAVAAVAAAKAAGSVSRMTGANREPLRSRAVGRPLAAPAQGARLQISWTYVEVRSRS